MSVAIVGAGALGRLAANILALQGQELLGYYDDSEDLSEQEIEGLPVLGTITQLQDVTPRPTVIIGVGEIPPRKALYERLAAQGFAFATAVHPTAVIGRTAQVSEGCIVKENAVVEIGTKVGANTIVGNGAVICHDSSIGEHCRIAPGVVIAGHVVIGEACYLSVRVSVDRRVTVGDNCVVASGCTLWKDVPDNAVVKLPAPMNVEVR